MSPETIDLRLFTIASTVLGMEQYGRKYVQGEE